MEQMYVSSLLRNLAEWMPPRSLQKAHTLRKMMSKPRMQLLDVPLIASPQHATVDLTSMLAGKMASNFTFCTLGHVSPRAAWLMPRVVGGLLSDLYFSNPEGPKWCYGQVAKIPSLLYNLLEPMPQTFMSLLSQLKKKKNPIMGMSIWGRNCLYQHLLAPSSKKIFLIDFYFKPVSRKPPSWSHFG